MGELDVEFEKIVLGLTLLLLSSTLLVLPSGKTCDGGHVIYSGEVRSLDWGMVLLFHQKWPLYRFSVGSAGRTRSRLPR